MPCSIRRATRPDPFLSFADGVRAGRRLTGRVTRLVPFGFFVEFADGVEGLVHQSERRRLSLSLRQP
ncbi:S1 RNA-binding domain-containing protein [Streptomyces griseorubiginosus]|uniref:S1 RNA-binding domain-containing protein n=1 Tax=Streptomyces griseorubiginosus TaxID=67304 RepID=UPI0036EA366C